MNIVKAQIADMDAVREIFRDYQAWLNEDVCFQGFEEELASLPGRYASPKGAIYLAYENNKGDEKDNGDEKNEGKNEGKGKLVACSGFRPRKGKEQTEAEFKRLFVREIHRGKGIGKILFLKTMLGAKESGYKTVVLETLPIMQAAKSLYIGYGYTPITAYFDNADERVEFYRYHFAEDE